MIFSVSDAIDFKLRELACKALPRYKKHLKNLQLLFQFQLKGLLEREIVSYQVLSSNPTGTHLQKKNLPK
jgi:hypothetical protein